MLLVCAVCRTRDANAAPGKATRQCQAIAAGKPIIDNAASQTALAFSHVREGEPLRRMGGRWFRRNPGALASSDYYQRIELFRAKRILPIPVTLRGFAIV